MGKLIAFLLIIGGLLFVLKYTWPILLLALIGGIIYIIYMNNKFQKYGIRFNGLSDISTSKELLNIKLKSIALVDKMVDEYVGITERFQQASINDTLINIEEDITDRNCKLDIEKWILEIQANAEIYDFFFSNLNEIFNVNREEDVEEFVTNAVLIKRLLEISRSKGYSYETIEDIILILRMVEIRQIMHANYISEINYGAEISALDKSILKCEFINKLGFSSEIVALFSNDIEKESMDLSLDNKEFNNERINSHIEKGISNLDHQLYQKIICINKSTTQRFYLFLIFKFLEESQKAVKNQEYNQIISKAINLYNNLESVVSKTFEIYNDYYIINSKEKIVSKLDYLILVKFIYMLKLREQEIELESEEYNVQFDKFEFNDLMAYLINNIASYRRTYKNIVKTWLYRNMSKKDIFKFLSNYLLLSIYLEKIEESKRKYELLNNQADDDSVSIVDIDIMSGVDFEEFLGKLFRRMGYESVVTPASGDYGIDLLVKKDNQIVAVQAKRYSESNVVGIKAVQEALGGKSYYKADKAMVITTSSFTKNAQNLAKENGIILWDRHELKKKIDELF